MINIKVDADAVTASAKGHTGRLAAGLSSGCRLWACASLLQGTMYWAPGLLAGLQCWSDNIRVVLAGYIRFLCGLSDIRQIFGIRMKYPFYYPYPKKLQISE